MRPDLQSYRHLASGKVREIYEIDSDTLLLVASDRISAYDHILSPAIGDKGRILTAMSFFWFDVLGVPNHLAGGPTDERIPAEAVGRSMVVRRLPMVQVECVARGYLTGSGLLDYQASGAVCGIALPAGLGEASKLPEPIFTPATKAEQGEHDENISFEHVVAQEGAQRAEALRQATLDIYSRGAEIAAERGIILADTKFEFGLGDDGELVLADEVLTPDSSRYWEAATYRPGEVQPSFDKQIVRNWLTGLDSGWDRASDTPPPALPDDVVARTRQRYIEAYEWISQRSFADWPDAEVSR
ncbi:phosphoribosylaminoimidazole-succinocarboxamides ynthase [Gordonia bronchialis DSM 43247]|uniref:Phosphoribosylaminoimidazole-succinocarboxamide synthase n=1 Tax=Gordonia bronchialis (strain ATCC 25592 / DSM 43247 / BCRC 13721 / JCM 3198 / KCTC 3076 / NBRC 16047 / NCTC 10667) TaxID=526226 RepID=D0L3F4_GORB4|nr:phosphoribosylaminoimidazolesuccinocarboxamide synthase [Gordonia bronchialis]ACY20153.1 phosphoribosylaminoimidazole-succinocarboxamides ynthase [Gordonia bronchialis DSM 43247]MCC3322926.1 phosphoribosylaminoimidazolesuccinocarboxamide synthase [Gordonia bronchialis]QGS26012.1 phosphoribosylaminoimidazolesuccinocarboxamide synthase [Gordonia bronchialis]UAK37589.1 phosphoribosylaminoimidazolesuccinocarboxamide synthase [Gordonia bronchialis]STQ62951.1 Phosphoribosylaminoimidazole-succinoc